VALTAGTRLGPYEIIGPLGAGGMGEVYRARDVRLQRDVAIKILPELFASDPERVARFHREAQAVAALNHPNIGAIFGFEESAHSKYLVLELVEGETLADRLGRGALALGEALTIARQIAEALEAAHARGIAHRDLKPANVKITPDVKVKVLDFGLAKALENTPGVTPDVSHSPTLSIAGTQVGMILGTAAYMSPEQAKGIASDHRGDLFSFGCVLYELITGRQAFEGDTVSEVLASVLKSEPDLGRLPSRLNPRIVDLLRRCLAKNPRDRWHAAADVRIEIESILADPRGPLVNERTAIPTPLWKQLVPLAAAVILTAVVTGLVVWNLRPEVTRPVTQFAHPVDEGTFNTGQPLALSPDGSQLVYAANQQLYRRMMSELEGTPIPGTRIFGGPRFPVVSPDGRSVAFWAQASTGGRAGTLSRIAVAGGAPVPIAEAQFPFGVSWTDEWILFGQAGKGILRVAAGGGTPEVVAAAKAGETYSNPHLLPGGKAILFSLATTDAADRWDSADIVIQMLDSGDRKLLHRGGSDARYVPTGHIVYGYRSSLFAVPFDLARLEVNDQPVQIVDGIVRSSIALAINNGAYAYSFSSNGSLVYAARQRHCPAVAGVHRSQRRREAVGSSGGTLPISESLARRPADRL
jgi:serine/threonine-protein kinase